MKWIDTNDLREWAKSRDCQETIPQLVRKLIRATSNSIKTIKFPSGENILTGGWDGILDVSAETEYLPLGTSLWEFGCSKDPKGKADDDYSKRSNNPLGYNSSECTFIFVTPRLWENGEDWVKEKKKDLIWKDVKVINAEILEEWLEVAPTVSAWLAIKHLSKFPSEGIQSTEDFWEEWSSDGSSKIKMLPDVLLGGRETQTEKMFELILNPSIIPIQAESREETLAFIIASFKNDSSREEDFFARSIIVDNPETFRKLSVIKNPLILIPRFEDDGVMNRAVTNGHTILVPLGRDSSDNWTNKMILPTIDREAFITALTNSGITKEDAERYSKESARNITILRRRLGFIKTIPEWARPENIRDIIPALLVGRWNESLENDRNIISRLAGDTYEEYSKKLNRWRYTSDSPLINVGKIWRLASPLDAWTNASKHLTPNDFEKLEISFLEIFNELNPIFELESEKRFMASLYGKNRKFSELIREGITQSLILISVFFKNFQLSLPISGEIWVDIVIAKLLNNDKPIFWKSIENTLPLLAEASPEKFLDAIDKKLSLEISPIASLFEEDKDSLSSTSYHTGLLWALESLAWFPQYLAKTSLILARLSAIDPGGRLSNRPINSFLEIFKPWHYQTLASLKERIEVLKLISQNEKEIAWTLLIRMLPKFHDTGFPTNKCRWRTLNQEFKKIISDKEIRDTHSEVISLLLSLFDFSESKLSVLIEQSINSELNADNREKLRSFIDNNVDQVNQIDFISWHTVRKILHDHRSYTEAIWALPESDLEWYEKLYSKLQPKNKIQKNLWIFDGYDTKFPDGFDHKKVPYEDQQKIIHEKRIEGLKTIYSQFGIEKIIELSFKVKNVSIYGNTLAAFLEEDSEILSVCEFLNPEKNNIGFAQGFISGKIFLNGNDWLFKLFEKLKQKGFNDKSLASLFIPLRQTQSLWSFIDSTNEMIKQEYWLSMIPYFWDLSSDEKTTGLKYLIEYQRYLTAIGISSQFAKEISTEIIVEILMKVATERANDNVPLNYYDVGKLFQTLDERSDIDSQTLLKLEWHFLPALASFDSNRRPKLLQEELSKDPAFFISVLKLCHISTSENQRQMTNQDLPEEQIKNRITHVRNLLDSWMKIPGVDNMGKIDDSFLSTWINEVRGQAFELGYIEVADGYIGKILAQYPKTNENNWPPNEICEIIEKINSDGINRNFSVGIYNNVNGGATFRQVYEGGKQEKILAKHFMDLSDLHRNKYPNVATIFNKLAKGYEEDARREDEQAKLGKLEY